MIKIVITRPVEGAGATIEQAQALGFQTVSFPLLKLSAQNGTVPGKSLTEYDWILFTSSNAVRFFISICGKNKISLAQPTRLAAVGPTTAKALGDFGLKADFVPGSFNRTAISNQIPIKKGQHILYPTIFDGPTRIEKILKDRQCIVERIDIYRSQAIVYSEQKWQKLSDEKAQVITFFSPRTVQAFFENKQQFFNLDDYICAVLAESSAEELSQFGYTARILAEIPTTENLLQKIKEYYE